MTENYVYISKLSFRTDEKLIDTVFANQGTRTNLGAWQNQDRNWLVNQYIVGSQIHCLTKDSNGDWERGNLFSYDGAFFSWNFHLPENFQRRKTFLSYYHHEDQNYKERAEKFLDDLAINKSVQDGEIDSDNSADYINELIQTEYMNDVTILLVLVGPNTKKRKHVDWEISGALDVKVGDRYAGLLGLLLPTHPDFGREQVRYDNLPKRLAANLESGYAIVEDWTDDRLTLQKLLEKTFDRRGETSLIVNRAIPQMERNLS